jgi:type IV fimbrial biogenesis protein FimT
MKTESGFTLIELLVTVAVVIILLTLAVPQLQQYSLNNRLVAQVNQLAGQLALARSEAVKRGTPITVCGSTDQASCDTSNWEDGSLVFIDANNDGVVDAGETVLNLTEPLGSGSTLRPSSFDSNTYLTFKPDGALRDIDGDGVNSGRFTLCDTRGAANARAIDVNNLGHPSRVEGATLTCP